MTTDDMAMGARRGGQGPAKNSVFLDFLAKNSIFFVVFLGKK
jgi:hypothetical protein